MIYSCKQCLIATNSYTHTHIHTAFKIYICLKHLCSASVFHPNTSTVESIVLHLIVWSISTLIMYLCGRFVLMLCCVFLMTTGRFGYILVCKNKLPIKWFVCKSCFLTLLLLFHCILKYIMYENKFNRRNVYSFEREKYILIKLYLEIHYFF